MKKITYFISIFVLTLLIVKPTNAYAVSCSDYNDDLEHCYSATDDQGRKCTYSNTNPVTCVPSSGPSQHSESSFTSDDEATAEDGEGASFLDEQKVVSCGRIKNIPDYIPFITSLTITILTIISMGMLVIMGTIDLFKGINSGKPEDMKKCQKAFYSRLGSAVFLFFIVALTKLLVSFFLSIAGGNGGIIDCIGCFINNTCN